MRIGVDLDGVVYDFVTTLRQWIHSSSGRSLASMPEALTWNFFKDQWGMTIEEYLDHFGRGVTAGVVFREGDPYPEAPAALRTLAAWGHELHIVTNRMQPSARENTCAWLAHWAIPFDSLTFAADKTTVPTDVFIEDNVENFQALARTATKPILFDRPWNSHLATDRRASDWKAVLNFVVTHKAETIAEEANRLVYADRGADYGHPSDDFTRTGRMWGAILGIPDVAPEHVGLCMAAVKISREVNKPKRDNRVDLAGYAATVDMVEERKAA